MPGQADSARLQSCDPPSKRWKTVLWLPYTCLPSHIAYRSQGISASAHWDHDDSQSQSLEQVIQPALPRSDLPPKLVISSSRFSFMLSSIPRIVDSLISSPRESFIDRHWLERHGLESL